MTVQRPSADDPTAFRPAEETPTVIVGEREARALQLTPGTVLGSRYRIVSMIGKGGMGDVYRADDLKLGQTVALKFISRHEAADRLYEEVRIGRQVSHPNVCRLYDIAEVDSHLFITMEFVDGEDLASLLRRIGRLPSEKALVLTRDICAGLSAAHDKGVIHRDLKPANVMIDGKGRARVTDFGLALAAGSASDSAGTPAYMAPEQLAGASASVRSDIYALGLVIYEIFTGRRTFEATSTSDLLARQQRGDFTRPSMVTRDIPAAVERIVIRCLEADPNARPNSVEEIIRELPGGDPLAAAIAAGETPTPGMVTAAADRGELSAAAAWTLLSIGIAGLIVYSALTVRTMLYRRVPLKSPAVLQERVEEILAATKHTLSSADADSFFGTDIDYLASIARGRRSLDRSPLLFMHRQSPRSLVAQNYEQRVTSNDPPLFYSGMADVLLDSGGRLMQFTIVPPQVDLAPATSVVDWTPFLRFADIGGPLRPTSPRWAAPVDSDQKVAWTVGSDGTRIEAAAYHGRPVWFAVIPPWRTPYRMIEPREEAGERIATIAVVVINAAFWAAAIVLALRNIRRGQSDRRGAWRLALVIFGAVMFAILLLTHHVAEAFDELILILTGLSLALLMAVETWIGYIAIEPLVRRRWPRMLIGTSRLLAGRVRDPMIGRDLLVGVVAGVLVVLLRQMTALFPGAALLQSAGLTLSGLRYVGWFAAAGFGLAIAGPIFAATLLVGIHVVVRNTRASVIITGALGSLMVMGDIPGSLWIRTIFAAVAAAAAVFLLLRFGLLAYGAAIFSYIFLRRVPITLDPSAWYFGRSAFALAILTGLLLYGFIISLGGKRWLPEVTVD